MTTLDAPRALPPLPVLLLMGVSANLTGDLRGRKSVAEVLVLLMDNAANLTAYDRELVRRLYEIAYCNPE